MEGTSRTGKSSNAPSLEKTVPRPDSYSEMIDKGCLPCITRNPAYAYHWFRVEGYDRTTGRVEKTEYAREITPGELAYLHDMECDDDWRLCQVEQDDGKKVRAIIIVDVPTGYGEPMSDLPIKEPFS